MHGSKSSDVWLRQRWHRQNDIPGCKSFSKCLRGDTRELIGERQEQFKRSIRDMGLSGTAADKGKGKQKAEYQVEEDLVSWEDTSQASLSASLQRRSRKSFKRADDEATLDAIQEVCW